MERSILSDHLQYKSQHMTVSNTIADRATWQVQDCWGDVRCTLEESA